MELEERGCASVGIIMFSTESCILVPPVPTLKHLFTHSTHTENRASCRWKVFKGNWSMEASLLKSPIKDTQVYFTSLIVPLNSLWTPERAHILRILSGSGLSAFDSGNNENPTTMGAGWKESLRVYTVTGGMGPHPRWLLAPFIVRLINNLWKCSIIVMAFRRPWLGCISCRRESIFL